MTISGPGNTRADAAESARAFSLVELLLVITIAGVLLAMGVGVWSSLRRRMDAEGSAITLVNIFRQASEAAASMRGSCTVLFVVDHDRAEDPDRSGSPAHRVPARVKLQYMEPIGEWHLEDAGAMGTTGAFGLHGIPSGARLCPEGAEESNPSLGGKIGRCFLFQKDGDCIRVADDQRLMPSGGIQMEAWIYRDNDMLVPDVARTILQKGTEKSLSYFMAVDQGGRPVAGWGGSTVVGGEVIPLRRWTHLKAVIRSRELELYVNGGLVARTDPEEPIAPKPGDFFISHPKLSFRGRIDEVRLLGIRETEWLPFAEDLTFTLDAGPVTLTDAKGFKRDLPLYAFWFDPQGGLDRNYHSAAVVVQMKPVEANGRKAAFQVGMNGQVDRIDYQERLEMLRPRYYSGLEELYED